MEEKETEKYTQPEVEKTIYQAKCKAERKRFGNATWRDDQQCDVFKIAIGIAKTNQDDIGISAKDDGSVLSVNDEGKHLQKVIMLSFWTQSLYWIGIVSLRQIQLTEYLA